MHQQVRTSPIRTGGQGLGADYDANQETGRGGVVELLGVLREAGINMQAAGGMNLDQKDAEFVFSVHHGDEDPDASTAEAVALLKSKGYKPYVIEPNVCEVEDEPGGLLGCIERIEARGDAVVEIHVGTGSPVPIQIVTRRHLEAARRAEASSD
jgi:hypothetical protein